MAWELPEDCVLGIFGAKPEPSMAGGGLCDEWGPDRAAELLDAMLFDTLETWSSDTVLAPGGRRVLVYAPADAGPWFDPRVPGALALQPQAPGDMGQRLQAFFTGELEDGAARAVAIFGNSPTLDPSLVVSALLCLEGRDLVLGPATDGGCYLVAVRERVPPIFDGVDWDGLRDLGPVIDRLEDTGLALALLPPWYRVTKPEHARMLSGHIRAMRRAGLNPHLPRLESLAYGFQSEA